MCSQYSNDINIYGIKIEIHLIIHSHTSITWDITFIRRCIL